MTELKTLKDFKKPKFKPVFIDREKLCSTVELRQEAIKWIKELIDDKPTNVSPMRIVGKNRLQQLEFTINWIKNFFNITEEEVK